MNEQQKKEEKSVRVDERCLWQSGVDVLPRDYNQQHIQMALFPRCRHLKWFKFGWWRHKARSVTDRRAAHKYASPELNKLLLFIVAYRMSVRNASQNDTRQTLEVELATLVHSPHRHYGGYARCLRYA